LSTPHHERGYNSVLVVIGTDDLLRKENCDI
jgi:hypothetical protein